MLNLYDKRFYEYNIYEWYMLFIFTSISIMFVYGFELIII